MRLFEENKYTRWYYSIISNRLSTPHDVDDYTERHHIIPKSLGGNNDPKNLVRLSPREHFLVHWLLPKMCISKNHQIKMNHALLRLMSASESIKTHNWSKWQYEKASENKRIALSEARKNGNDPRLGKKHSDESKEKMRLAKLGVKRDPEKIGYLKTRKVTAETKQKISKSLTGRSVSEDTREKLRKSNVGKKQKKRKAICTVCGQENYLTQIKRYHNDNCKHRESV